MFNRFLLLTLLLLTSFSGCASASKSSPANRAVVEPPPVLLTKETPDFESSRSYNKLKTVAILSDEYEKVRIEYLLERIGASPYNFIRNGEESKSKKTVMFLKWKMFRRKKEYKTAEDFVHKIANGSRMSGKAYYVNIEGKDHLVESVLQTELRLMDKALADYHAQQAIVQEVKLGLTADVPAEKKK